MEFPHVTFKPWDEVALLNKPRQKLWIFRVMIAKESVTYEIWDGYSEYYIFEPWQIAEYVPITE